MQGEKPASTLWAVLPTFNEVENLAAVVAAIREAAPDIRILIVDDASPDGTGQLADTIAAAGAPLDVLHRTPPRGLGDAYRDGFREVLGRGAEAVVTMDCDFSHDPHSIPQLRSALSADNNVVIGSRYVDGGSIVNWPWYRLLLSATANRFVASLFALPARDCTSGFRIYRRAALEAIPWDRIHSTGYSFLVETLWWAVRGGARLSEVPICFRDRTRGDSKMGVKEIVVGAVNLIRLRIETAGRR